MPIAVECPYCSRSMTAPDDSGGRQAKCKGCGQTIRVPEPPRALLADPIPIPVNGDPEDSPNAAKEAASIRLKLGGRQSREPWFYRFLDNLAWMVTVLACGYCAVMSLFGVLQLVMGEGLGLLMLLYLALGLVPALLIPAFIHLAVDMARTLRAIRDRLDQKITD